MDKILREDGKGNGRLDTGVPSWEIEQPEQGR